MPSSSQVMAPGKQKAGKGFDPPKEEELSGKVLFTVPYSPLQGVCDIEVPNIAVSHLGATTKSAIEPR